MEPDWPRRPRGSTRRQAVTRTGRTREARRHPPRNSPSSVKSTPRTWARGRGATGGTGGSIWLATWSNGCSTPTTPTGTRRRWLAQGVYHSPAIPVSTVAVASAATHRRCAQPTDSTSRPPSASVSSAFAAPATSDRCTPSSPRRMASRRRDAPAPANSLDDMSSSRSDALAPTRAAARTPRLRGGARTWGRPRSSGLRGLHGASPPHDASYDLAPGPDAPHPVATPTSRRRPEACRPSACDEASRLPVSTTSTAGAGLARGR